MADVKWYDYVLIYPLVLKALRALENADRKIELAGIALQEVARQKKINRVLVNLDVVDYDQYEDLRKLAEYANDKHLGNILIRKREEILYALRKVDAPDKRLGLIERIAFIDELFETFAELENQYFAKMEERESKSK